MFLFTRCLLVLLLCVVPIWGGSVSVDTVLRTLDGLRNLEQDVTAKVSIAIQDKDQGNKLLEAVYFAKDLDDQFLIVMTKPEAEKGNGYLKIGKNFWMYRRNTRTFQHVTRTESIGGSDANTGDFEAPKYARNYRAVKTASGEDKVETTSLGKVPVYRLEIVSDMPDVDYPKKILWVRQDNFLPLKEESYALSGTLMNTQYYLKYTQINGKYIPVRQMVVDDFEKGNKTLWEMTDIVFKPLDQLLFTKGYLENLSK